MAYNIYIYNIYIAHPLGRQDAPLTVVLDVTKDEHIHICIYMYMLYGIYILYIYIYDTY